MNDDAVIKRQDLLMQALVELVRQSCRVLVAEQVGA